MERRHAIAALAFELWISEQIATSRLRHALRVNVERLVLDVDALVHARHPRLLPEIEALIRALPDRAYMERAVRVEAVASRLTEPRARDMCAAWGRDRFSAARPIDYSGSFERERALRDAQRPLPF